MRYWYKQIYKVRHIIFLSFLFLIATRIIFFATGNFSYLYLGRPMGHFIAFNILVAQNLQRPKKIGEILMMFGCLLSMVDNMGRLYFPPIIFEINQSVVFLCCFFFMRGRIEIKIKDNVIFLTAYAVFYFLISSKMLASVNLDVTNLVSIWFSLVLSMVFAYSLLAVSKLRNFYHCTYCCGVSLLCIVILGKRVTGSHTNAFIFVQQICAIFMIISMIYWYKETENYAGSNNQVTIFNVQPLINAVSGLLFVLYLFQIADRRLLVWGLFCVILSWYTMSIANGYKKRSFLNKNNTTIFDELTPNQLDRLNRYACHIKNSNHIRN